jgi:Zn-dependent protease with chaperone function
MRIPWRLRFLMAAFLLALMPSLFLPVRAHGQAPPAASDEDSDDDAPVDILSVTITLDVSGKANVQAMYGLADKSDFPQSEVKNALQSTLGCTIHDSPRVSTISGFYVGSCAVPLSAQGLLRQGRISTAPLQEVARLHNIASPSVQLHLPADSEVLETIPAAGASFSNLPAGSGAGFNRYMRSFFLFVGSAEKPLPPEILFRYGYAPSTLQKNAVLLPLVLLFPLALFMWLGRKALSADVADKAVVWFSYMRWLQWILSGSLIAWWMALDYCHAEPLLRFISSGTRFAALGAHPVAYQAISWVPPAIVWLLCYRISHPVQQKLRGLRWTKRELTLQALYSVLAGLFPFAMFLTGLRVIPTGGFRTAMYWWVAAFLLRVVAAQALLKVTGMQPQALSSGDLRDRAFGLAERLGIKLQQIYLIPSGKGQVANAFARTGNTISFTDFLLQRMSQREVDFVMAHELTHLKLKHPAKLGYAYLGGLFLAMLSVNVPLGHLHGSAAAHSALLFTEFIRNSSMARYAWIFIVISVFPYFWSRRFEYAADAGAVTATGDPRAAISALFKLSELNMMPIHWSKWHEKWLTHPSSLRRARAIARKANISAEEIPAIAREGATETQNYVIPASAAAGGKVHSTQRTKSASLKLSLALVALFAFVPSLFSLAAIHLAAPLKWIVFGAAIPATLISFLVFFNYASRLARGKTIGSLKKKLESQGVQTAAWSGVFVGLSPAAAPRIYEGNASWDIGYLFFRSDRVCYCGEEAKFSLRQNQITAIKVGSGMPALVPTKRIYIAWKDDERAASGVFNIVCGKAGSALDANKLTKELAQRLEAWRKTPPVPRPLPPQFEGLTSPEVRAVTSQSPAERRKPQKLYNELFWTGVFAGVGATICGLPFHLVPYFVAASNPSLYARAGVHAPFSTPGAGWFAVGVAVLVRFVTLFPLLLYRDKPKLVAEVAGKRPDALVPSEVAHTDAAQEKVLVS